MKRITSRGADRTNYRRTLNRAYLVLSLIWIFAGLIHPLYQADELRASSEQQLKDCLRAAIRDHIAVKDCYERDKSEAVPRDPVHAFEATYGEVRQWPISIFLVCILPPLLCYGVILFVIFVLSASLPRSQPARKQT